MGIEYEIHPDNWVEIFGMTTGADCWTECGDQGGSCSFCGADGYCCSVRDGAENGNCPTEAFVPLTVHFNADGFDHHMCVVPGTYRLPHTEK